MPLSGSLIAALIGCGAPEHRARRHDAAETPDRPDYPRETPAAKRIAVSNSSRRCFRRAGSAGARERTAPGRAWACGVPDAWESLLRRRDRSRRSCLLPPAGNVGTRSTPQPDQAGRQTKWGNLMADYEFPRLPHVQEAYAMILVALGIGRGSVAVRVLHRHRQHTPA